MTGALVALGVFACGLGAVVGMAYIVAPSSLRRRPDDPRAPKVIAAEFQSGRGGHSALWSVPADPGEYSKIWSDDRN